MPRRWMKVSRPISPILNPKIGCHGKVPWAIGNKGGEIGNLRSNIYHNGENVVKIGQLSWDSFAQKIITK